MIFVHPRVGLSNCFRGPCKETLLREWYHATMDVQEFASGEVVANESELLFESDSEKNGCSGKILVQSDSDQEPLMATPPYQSGDVLLATDSEPENSEPPLKKQRRYAARRSKDHQLLFLGKPVCRFAHMRLYSVGSGSLQNLRKGNKAFTMHSGRLKEPHHPTLGVSLVRNPVNQKWPSILSFFWLLWTSCAEILPIKFTMPGNDGRSAENLLKKDPDFQERYVQNFLACLERNYDMNPATRCL